MNEQELQGFISVITRYFEQTTRQSAEMQVPFVLTGKPIILDVTGAIGISGARRGAIYFTAPAAMISALSQHLLGSPVELRDDLIDLTGEICNTIAGNMREQFGSSFMISVPIIIHGSGEQIRLHLREPVFIIPLAWHGLTAYLAIGLE